MVKQLACIAGWKVIDGPKKSLHTDVLCVTSSQKVWVNVQNTAEKCTMYRFKAAELSIFETFGH